MEEVEVEFGIVDFEGVLNDDDTYSVSIRGGELRIFKLKRKRRFWGGICLRERFVSVNEDDENGNLERETRESLCLLVNLKKDLTVGTIFMRSI